MFNVNGTTSTVPIKTHPCTAEELGLEDLQIEPPVSSSELPTWPEIAQMHMEKERLWNEGARLQQLNKLEEFSQDKVDQMFEEAERVRTKANQFLKEMKVPSLVEIDQIKAEEVRLRTIATQW